MNQFQLELRKMMDQLTLTGTNVGEAEEVSNWVKSYRTIQSIVRLPGDASTRKYYRILSEGRSFIVMRLESFVEQKESLPFLVVQNHLNQSGVAVPQVLDIDAERGFILLEDLGDVTLLRKLQEVGSPDVERHMYERILDLLISFQVQASPKVDQKGIVTNDAPHLNAFDLKFDHEKLMWEIDFTLENFYKLHLKRTFDENDYALIRNGFSEICQFLADQPTVLSHRDFHSRNVMAMPDSSGSNTDRWVMIDFQDARMGPPQYDLASLLKDSYYQLEESQIGFLLDYYIAKYEALAGQSVDRSHFMRVFDLMSVQRNFKAIGSFASFMNRRSDPSYLKYIGNTFENIRRTLLKYPRYSQMREKLFHYYYF